MHASILMADRVQPTKDQERKKAIQPR